MTVLGTYTHLPDPKLFEASFQRGWGFQRARRFPATPLDTYANLPDPLATYADLPRVCLHATLHPRCISVELGVHKAQPRRRRRREGSASAGVQKMYAGTMCCLQPLLWSETINVALSVASACTHG